MSDFLQFVDRVPTLPNRKKITHADSSVEYATVEYADEPIETGTPLSKSGFNRLNAVLGYNELTAIQEFEQGEKIVTTPQISGTTIQTSRTSSKSTATGTATSNFGSIDCKVESISYVTKMYLNNTYIQLFSARYNSSSHYVGFSLTFENEVMLEKLHLSSTTGSDYDWLFDISKLHIQDINGNELTWIPNGQVGGKAAYKSSGYVKTMYLPYESRDTFDYNYVTNIHFDDTRYESIVWTNKFSDSSISEFVNQQVYDIKPIINQGEEAQSNKLNEKPIDTLLESGKYYELLYDEPNDRFIAHEERV